MKATILAAALPLLFSVGCTSRQSEQLTQQQTDKIKSEVKAVGDSLMARFARLDGPGTFQFYANTPHWVMFNADGTQWDYETTRKGMTDSVSAFASYKYHTLHEDYWVVNKDMVIGASVIKDEYTMKSGDKMTYDQHAYTVIFERIAGQWKVVWSQDSGTPVIQKTVAAHRPRH